MRAMPPARGISPGRRKGLPAPAGNGPATWPGEVQSVWRKCAGRGEERGRQACRSQPVSARNRRPPRGRRCKRSCVEPGNARATCLALAIAGGQTLADLGTAKQASYPSYGGGDLVSKNKRAHRRAFGVRTIEADLLRVVACGQIGGVALFQVV